MLVVSINIVGPSRVESSNWTWQNSNGLREGAAVFGFILTRRSQCFWSDLGWYMLNCNYLERAYGERFELHMSAIPRKENKGLFCSAGISVLQASDFGTNVQILDLVRWDDHCAFILLGKEKHFHHVTGAAEICDIWFVLLDHKLN